MDDTLKNKLAKIGVAIGIPLGLACGIWAASIEPAEAGLFDSISTSSWRTIQSDKFKIDAYGYDVRAYEWVSPNDPTQICVMTFAGSGKGAIGMQCWEKGTQGTDER